MVSCVEEEGDIYIYIFFYTESDQRFLNTFETQEVFSGDDDWVSDTPARILIG